MNEDEYFRLLNQVMNQSRKFEVKIHVEFVSKRGDDGISAIIENIEREINLK